MGPRALPMGLKIGLNSIAMPFFGFFPYNVSKEYVDCMHFAEKWKHSMWALQTKTSSQRYFFSSILITESP